MLHFITLFAFCDLAGIRTPDPQLRRLLLYPAELRDQHSFKCGCNVAIKREQKKMNFHFVEREQLRTR